jgi:hypothetical protein
VQKEKERKREKKREKERERKRERGGGGDKREFATSHDVNKLIFYTT